MVRGREDTTLQAHRGSYKTTCVSLALSIIIVLLPNKKTLFLRKTDTDVKEIIRQVQNILRSSYMQTIVKIIHGVELEFTTDSATEISTTLSSDTKGTAQLVGRGISGSLTGKHFDRIFTDDIVNLQDRVSKAERDHTKVIYQELQNIKNRGGRIYNTGTPWHKEDCFTLMPNPQKWDCYTTGLISPDDLERIRSNMTTSLFAANYELKHIADEDAIFTDEQYADDEELACDGCAHVDAAYGGSDSTAMTIMQKKDGLFYIYGRMWQRHVDGCMDEIIAEYERFRCGKLWLENNGDKGYLAKELRNRGIRTISYHEDMNKHLKITTYLVGAWNNVRFIPGTDKEYINEILDYNENAEHDDAPDSCASLIRKQYWKKDEGEALPDNSIYGGRL